MAIISIDKEKKQRLKKKIIHQLTFVVTAIIIIAVIVYSLLTNKFVELAHTVKNLSSGNNFPIVAKQHQLQEVQNLGNYLTVLTKASVFFYDLKGNVVSEVTHGLTNPVMKTNKNYCLIYDRGGMSYKLLSPFKIHIDKKTTNKILTANLSENGSVAIAQLNPRYSTYLNIVDNQGDTYYEWFSAHDKLVDLAFNPASTGLAAATVIPDQGLMTTVVYGLDFKSEEETFKSQIIGSNPYNISYKSNGNITIVGDTVVSTMNDEGTIKSQYFPSTDVVGFTVTPQNTYLITESLLSKNHTIHVLNRAGEISNKADFHDRQARSHYSNGVLYILANDMLYNYSVSTNKIENIQIDKEYKDLTVVNGTVYLLDENEIVKL